MFKQILSSLDVKKVLEFYGLKFNSKNFASCPFHKDKTASLKVYTKTQTFQCFSCNRGGDFVTFVSRMFGLKNYEALKKIDNDFALGIIKEEITQEEMQKIREAIKKKRAEEKKQQVEKKRVDDLCGRFRILTELCNKYAPERFKEPSKAWFHINQARMMVESELISLEIRQ